MNQRNKTLQVSYCLTLALLPLLLLSGAAWGQSGTITSTNFGMQCGNGTSTNCPGFALPTNRLGQPGLLRLISANVYWADLEPPQLPTTYFSWSGCTDIQQVNGVDTYCWENLDKWLDAVAATPYIQAVDYVFLGIPCQLSNPSECGTGGSSDPNGLNYPPPNDLGSSGSASFNNFVTQLTKHCSPKGNCVANIIKYYEMWNEPNGTYWYDGGSGGSELQLEEMVFPARNIIWQNVQNAVVMTPGWAGENPQSATWIQTWLDAENSYVTANGGTLSNAVAFHDYLNNAATAVGAPEENYTCYIDAATSSAASTCDNPNKPSLLYLTANTPGWASTPWLLTETNFTTSTFACSLSDVADCTGQIVRWQLLADAAGARSLDWFYWNQTIGANTSYDPAYYYMMQSLEGGQFTSTCSNTTGTIWTCPFTDAAGNSDLWVWTTNETAQSYSTSYSDYWTVAGSGQGTCTAIPNNFTVTVEPYLLTNSCQTSQTITGFNSSSSTYGNTVTLSATGGGSGNPVVFSVVSGPGSVSGTNGSTLSFTGVGTVEVAANQAGSTYYAAATQVTAYITVNPATLTVTANNASMNTGAALPTFTATYSGFVNGDTSSVVGGAPSFATTATSSSPAGTYPITVTQGTLSAANYTFSFVNGTLSVVQPPAISLSTTSSVSGSAAEGYTLTITVTNTGTGTVTGLTLTSATLGSASGSNLPQTLGGTGTLAAGAFNSFTISVPGSAGADGAGVAERYSGTCTGGSFGGSVRSVILP